MNATQEYEARLNANEIAFRAACVKLGFKGANKAEIFELDRVRLWLVESAVECDRPAPKGKRIEIMVFAGAPGHSPVQYSIPIDLWAPAEVAIATLKAVLKTTK